MQGLQQFTAFVETAKHGGFAAAARELGVAPSTLAKSVARLESGLGVKLFHRTTRQVTLTPDGERLFERCQNVLAEIEDLQAAASGARTELAGTLRVDLPVFYGKRFVMPILARLAAQHPGLKLDIRLSDVKIDLIREGIDLAVRIGQLSDSSLVAKRIDQQHLVLCASPAYLAQHGRPETVADLARHAAVRFRLPTSGRDRPWQLTCDGEAIVLSPPAHVRIDETEGLLEALTLGLGMGQIPDILVQDALDRGELIELLPQCRPAPMPIHILYASGRLMPARVRLVIEALETLRLRESRH